MLLDRLLGGGLLACALLLASPVEATTVRAFSLFEKAQLATQVVYARVEGVESSWELEGGSVKTLITVSVLESWKGPSKKGDRLILRQAGGQVGTFRHHIEGMDQFVKGAQVVLFLEPLKNLPYLVPIGIGIGKYDLEDRAGSAWVVHHPRVALAHIQPNQPMRIEAAAAAEPERFDRFERRVRGYIAGQKPRNHDLNRKTNAPRTGGSR